MKGSSRRALHAMIGPEGLLPIAHADGFKRGRAGMRSGEGAMTWWMPVVGQHDMVEALSEAIDNRHHGIAVGNRKRAAGAEIVLHVDDQQHIVIANLHFGPAIELISKNSSAKQNLSQQDLQSTGASAALGLLSAPRIPSRPRTDPARRDCLRRTP